MFAIVGVCLALWASGWLPKRDSQRAFPAPNKVAPRSPDPATLHSLVFQTLTNSTDVDSVMGDIEMKVQSLARADNGLKSLGEDVIASLAKAAALSIKPYLLGSFEEYQKSVQAMGGEPSESQSLWESRKLQFSMRPVSADGVSVVPFASNGVTTLAHERVSSVRKFFGSNFQINTISTPDRYPSVTSYKKKKLDVYEVRLPIKAAAFKLPDHEINAEIGVALAFDAKTRKWQPVQYIVYQPASGIDDPHLLGIVY